MTRAHTFYLAQSAGDDTIRVKSIGVETLIKKGLQALRPEGDAEPILSLGLVYCNSTGHIADIVTSEKFMREVDALSRDKILFVILPKTQPAPKRAIIGDVVRLLPVNGGDDVTIDKIVRATVGNVKRSLWRQQANGILFVRLAEDGTPKKVFHQPICMPTEAMTIDHLYEYLVENFACASAAAEYDRTKAAPKIKRAGKAIGRLFTIYSTGKDVFELGKLLLG